jgi:hypothetical protein
MDAKQQADAINSAIQDDIPEMKPAPNTVVELIRGVFNDELESWDTTAIVRELNGFDEEALASLDNRSLVYAEYMSTLLKRAVVSIGSIAIANHPSVIDNLIIGDRDLLFLGVIEATYGKNREYQVTCGACNASNDVIVSMDEFENKKTDLDVHQPLVGNLSDGSKIELRLPTGGDSQFVAKKAKSTAEQNTIMIARCVTSKHIKNAENWAKGLGLKDRANLVKLLLDNQPGPVVGEVNAQCATCNEPMVLALDWASLLFG